MIRLNDLQVTLICCRRHTPASRPEAGEYSALFAVEDPKTGEKGHWAYIYEWDKRDVMLEQAHTDNPALVCYPDEDTCPSCYEWGQVRDDIGIEPIGHPAWDTCIIQTAPTAVS